MDVVLESALHDIGPDWAQGRALFGGILGSAIAAALPRTAPLRSMQVQFLAPAHPGPLTAIHREVRRGRTLVHHEVLLTQAQAVVSAQIATALDRPSQILWAPSTAPGAPDPLDLVALPYIEGVTPRFTQQFEYRWAEGGLPFTGSATANFGGLVRFRAAERVGLLGGIAILDAWPAPVLPLLSGPAPASTVQWMLNFVHGSWTQTWDGAAWWRFAASTRFAGEGLATFDAELWSPDGVLFASSRQLVVEFSGRG